MSDVAGAIFRPAGIFPAVLDHHVTYVDMGNDVPMHGHNLANYESGKKMWLKGSGCN